MSYRIFSFFRRLATKDREELESIIFGIVLLVALYWIIEWIIWLYNLIV